VHASPSRPSRRLALAGLIACAFLSASAAAQQPIPSTLVRFAPGSSSATIKGQLKGPGNATRDYVVRAGPRQTMSVTIETRSSDTYFNVMHPLSLGEAVFNGEAERRESWSGDLIDGGDWRVRVYLGNEAARQGKGATYTLRIELK
jgi:hypothetical protein